jgi:hypothetical protein
VLERGVLELDIADDNIWREQLAKFDEFGAPRCLADHLDPVVTG